MSRANIWKRGCRRHSKSPYCPKFVEPLLYYSLLKVSCWLAQRLQLGSGYAAVLRFNRFHLGKPPNVPLLVRELCSHKRPYQILRQFDTDDALAEHQNVDVVVLDALMCRVRVVTHAAADPGHFVDRYTRSHTTAANQHAAFRFAVQYRPPQGFRKIRIVRRVFVERA